MSINLDDRYPGRANGKTLSYPQGSFKNRTSPTSKDGTFLEQDWANDQLAFFQSLIKNAGMTANGAVDTAEASQYFDALKSILEAATPSASEAVKGIIQLATSAQTKALTNDESALTPKKLADVLGLGVFDVNGYVEIPAKHPSTGSAIKLFLQWGQALNVTTTASNFNLPIAFPNAGFSVTAIHVASGSIMHPEATISKTSLSIRMNSGSGTANWIAIGY